MDGPYQFEGIERWATCRIEHAVVVTGVAVNQVGGGGIIAWESEVIRAIVVDDEVVKDTVVRKYSPDVGVGGYQSGCCPASQCRESRVPRYGVVDHPNKLGFGDRNPSSMIARDEIVMHKRVFAEFHYDAVSRLLRPWRRHVVMHIVSSDRDQLAGKARVKPDPIAVVVRDFAVLDDAAAARNDLHASCMPTVLEVTHVVAHDGTSTHHNVRRFAPGNAQVPVTTHIGVSDPGVAAESYSTKVT